MLESTAQALLAAAVAGGSRGSVQLVRRGDFAGYRVELLVRTSRGVSRYVRSPLDFAAARVWAQRLGVCLERGLGNQGVPASASGCSPAAFADHEEMLGV